MREIKFRLWIHDWGGGRMVDDGFAVNETGQVYFLNDEVGGYVRGYSGKQDRIVMQYTGLKDKNGKEIYEGDIVKWRDYDTDINHNQQKHDWVENGLAKVEFGEYLGLMCFYMRELDTLYFTKMDKVEMEVVGNIYQNPELIK